MLRVFAPAKVNLCLHVTGQRADGYHLLDSLVAFADVGDWLTLRRASAAEVQVVGPEAAALVQGGVNIISQTLARFGVQDVAVQLEKHLPVASGIGGGSADAAATYRGLCALLGRAALTQDAADLLALGADVPMCVPAKPARVQGIGERITPLPNLPALSAVLVNPRQPVSTPAVFRALPQKQNPGLAPMPPHFADAAALMAWLAQQRNDLQPPAQTIAPVITGALAALAQSGAALARMSGSGATCFGLYPSAPAAQAAAHSLRSQQPQWWIAPCTLNGPLDIAPQAIRATT
jgi:4-diphosphocytidyl-2-C-methyl-D-erythritol kinase